MGEKLAIRGGKKQVPEEVVFRSMNEPLVLPKDMDEINAIAKRHKPIVFEDACQAHGALYNRKKTGILGNMGAFSLRWMYRMDEILAAVARGRLRRLDADNARRQESCGCLSRVLGKIPGVIPPHIPVDRTHVFYFYRVRFDGERFK